MKVQRRRAYLKNGIWHLNVDLILAAKLSVLLVLKLLLKERYFTQIGRHRVKESRAPSHVEPDSDHKPEHVVSTSWLRNMKSCPGDDSYLLPLG